MPRKKSKWFNNGDDDDNNIELSENEGTDYDTEDERDNNSVYDDTIDDQELINYSEQARKRLTDYLRDLSEYYKGYEPDQFLYDTEKAKKEENNRWEQAKKIIDQAIRDDSQKIKYYDDIVKRLEPWIGAKEADGITRSESTELGDIKKCISDWKLAKDREYKDKREDLQQSIDNINNAIIAHLGKWRAELETIAPTDNITEREKAKSILLAWERELVKQLNNWVATDKKLNDEGHEVELTKGETKKLTALNNQAKNTIKSDKLETHEKLVNSLVLKVSQVIGREIREYDRDIEETIFGLLNRDDYFFTQIKDKKPDYWDIKNSYEPDKDTWTNTDWFINAARYYFNDWKKIILLVKKPSKDQENAKAFIKLIDIALKNNNLANYKEFAKRAEEIKSNAEQITPFRTCPQGFYCEYHTEGNWLASWEKAAKELKTLDLIKKKEDEEKEKPPCDCLHCSHGVGTWTWISCPFYESSIFRQKVDATTGTIMGPDDAPHWTPPEGWTPFYNPDGTPNKPKIDKQLFKMKEDYSVETEEYKPPYTYTPRPAPPSSFNIPERPSQQTQQPNYNLPPAQEETIIFDYEEPIHNEYNQTIPISTPSYYTLAKLSEWLNRGKISQQQYNNISNYVAADMILSSPQIAVLEALIEEGTLSQQAVNVILKIDEKEPETIQEPITPPKQVITFKAILENNQHIGNYTILTIKHTKSNITKIKIADNEKKEQLTRLAGLKMLNLEWEEGDGNITNNNSLENDNEGNITKLLTINNLLYLGVRELNELEQEALSYSYDTYFRDFLVEKGKIEKENYNVYDILSHLAEIRNWFKNEWDKEETEGIEASNRKSFIFELPFSTTTTTNFRNMINPAKVRNWDYKINETYRGKKTSILLGYDNKPINWTEGNMKIHPDYDSPQQHLRRLERLQNILRKEQYLYLKITGWGLESRSETQLQFHNQKQRYILINKWNKPELIPRDTQELQAYFKAKKLNQETYIKICDYIEHTTQLTAEQINKLADLAFIGMNQEKVNEILREGDADSPDDAWKRAGFNLYQKKEWIDVGLDEEYEAFFAKWLKNNGWTPEKTLNQGNKEQLKQQWLNSIGIEPATPPPPTPIIQPAQEQNPVYITFKRGNSGHRGIPNIGKNIYNQSIVNYNSFSSIFLKLEEGETLWDSNRKADEKKCLEGILKMTVSNPYIDYIIEIKNLNISPFLKKFSMKRWPFIGHSLSTGVNKYLVNDELNWYVFFSKANETQRTKLAQCLDSDKTIKLTLTNIQNIGLYNIAEPLGLLKQDDRLTKSDNLNILIYDNDWKVELLES